jgi:hypothetical protein
MLTLLSPPVKRFPCSWEFVLTYVTGEKVPHTSDFTGTSYVNFLTYLTTLRQLSIPLVCIIVYAVFLNKISIDFTPALGPTHAMGIGALSPGRKATGG